MIELTEPQRDALVEMFNIGVGRAADSLSQLVNEPIGLSAPIARLMHPRDLATHLLGTDQRHFSTVSQNFSGPLDARAMLVFPENNALEIVRLMVGEHVSVEDLSDFEQEAMCEVGNIILNACISALADVLGLSLHCSLPEHHFGGSGSLPLLDRTDEGVVLVLQMDMIISNRQIQGHILFLLSIESLTALLELVNRYLAKLGLT